MTSSTENASLTEAASIETQQPWLTFLTELASKPNREKMVSDVVNMLKNFLLSDSENAASETAKQIDNYTLFGTLTRRHLNFVFQTIYNLAALIPFEDQKQEMLLQLIVELLKMPRRSITHPDGKMVDEVPICYDINMEIKHDMWNARHVDEFDLDYKTQDEYTQGCIEWINLSKFYARCIAEGLDDHDDRACKFPGYDIPEALEQQFEYTPGIDTDFRVMVATQYIIIAGEEIRKDDIKWWDEHAPIWEKNLEQLENSYENGFLEVAPRFETPPGEKELIGTGDLGMDILGSVKDAREKLKELGERASEQESKKTTDTPVGSENPAEKNAVEKNDE
ncbi:7645bf5e-8cef-4818-810a-18047dcf956a [Sclerotinia trifoliorum]|uniref:7645bf5e-8cef-4818-810a-18047dcf956a n=1 Tax=Sclerotinia trifoliorum TaxID=28548 RepID=A0A8H2VTF5_9HELO|nr:7645bf5e-8cef-4818-810a-18047dcf956a [Sclerotinia trifoliorum]